MKNGKLFSKLSLIDLAVILLVVLIVVVAVVRIGLFGTPEEAEEQTQTVTYEKVECLVTLQYASIPAYLIGQPIHEGETLYAGGKAFGTVESVQQENATVRSKKQDGTIVTVTCKDAYNYNVTLKTTLTKKDGMLYFEKIPVAVGLGQTFVGHYYSGKAYVTSVEKIQ